MSRSTNEEWNKIVPPETHFRCQICGKDIFGLGDSHELCITCAVMREQERKEEWLAWMDALRDWDNRGWWQKLKDWRSRKAVPVQGSTDG